MTISRLALLVAVTSGCVVEADLGEIEQLALKQPGDDNCGSYGCGQNSPDMLGLGFWELNERGLPNVQGMKIIGFGKYMPAWTELTPDVQNGQLVGKNASGVVVIGGANMAGSRFTISTPLNGQFYITIQAVAEMHLWAKNGHMWPYTFTYEIVYTNTSSSTNPRNVCKEAGKPTGDDMNPGHAVLFDDDRIDPDSISVGAPVADWFTFGCAGSALAKEHLTGNTKAAGALLGVTTTVRQRQASLKMLTADYCGKGDPFTVAGISLHYRDVSGRMDTVVPNEKIEALWTENGAVCVNKPRIVANPTTYSQQVFPDLTQSLKDFGCTLPPACTPGQYAAGYAYNGAYMLSANP